MEKLNSMFRRRKRGLNMQTDIGIKSRPSPHTWRSTKKRVQITETFIKLSSFYQNHLFRKSFLSVFAKRTIQHDLYWHSTASINQNQCWCWIIEFRTVHFCSRIVQIWSRLEQICGVPDTDFLMSNLLTFLRPDMVQDRFLMSMPS